MSDLTDLPDEKTLIQAVLNRREGADKELRLVIEGALVNSDSYNQRFRLQDHDIKLIPTSQLARRLKRLGLERMLEVFAILAPGLEFELHLTWEWMRSRQQRFGDGFRYPHDLEKKEQYEAWWLSEIFKDMTRFPMPPLRLAGHASTTEVAGRATDATADYLACSIVGGGGEGEEVIRYLKDALKNKTAAESVTKLIANTLIRIPRMDGWEALRDVLLTTKVKNAAAILNHAFEGGDEAFHFLADAVCSRGLLRRPDVLKATNAWTDSYWKRFQVANAQADLEQLCRCLADPEYCEAQTYSENAGHYYVALWVKARCDADAVSNRAIQELRQSISEERRFAALRFLTHVDIVAAHQAVCSAIGDPDLRIACHAVEIVCAKLGVNQNIDKSELSKNCAALLGHIESAPKELPPLVWPWFRLKPSASDVLWLKPNDSLLQQVHEAPEVVVSDALDVLTIEKLREEAELLPIGEVPTFWRTRLEAVSARYEIIYNWRIRAMMSGALDFDESPFPRQLRDLRWSIMDELVAKWADEALCIGKDWAEQDEEFRLNAGIELLQRLCDAPKSESASHEITQAYLIGHRKREQKNQVLRSRSVNSAT